MRASSTTGQGEYTALGVERCGMGIAIVENVNVLGGKHPCESVLGGDVDGVVAVLVHAYILPWLRVYTRGIHCIR